MNFVLYCVCKRSQCVTKKNLVSTCAVRNEYYPTPPQYWELVWNVVNSILKIKARTTTSSRKMCKQSIFNECIPHFVHIYVVHTHTHTHNIGLGLIWNLIIQFVKSLSICKRKKWFLQTFFYRSFGLAFLSNCISQERKSIRAHARTHAHALAYVKWPFINLRDR